MNSDYDDGYDSGFSDGLIESQRSHQNLLDQAEFDYLYNIAQITEKYDSKINNLVNHLRLKDDEIESCMDEINELRKMNEELQQIIKANSR